MEDYKTSYDVIFVSAFGRHHWLSKELAKNEWQVGHVDVSRLLGSWSEQDLKNPFGMSMTSNAAADANPAQVDAWKTMVHAQKVSHGVSLLMDRGPFEGSGPLKEFFKTKLAIKTEVSDVLSAKSQVLETEADLDQKIKSLGFEDLWLVNLSRQMASSVYLENAKSSLLDNGVPIFDELYKDCSTIESRSSESFFREIVLAKNIEPSRFSSVQKAADGFFEIGLEVPFEGGAKSSGLYPLKMRSRVLVWALTSAETEFLSHDVSQFLFAGKNIEPTWSWQRFSFSGPAEVIERWPIQFFSVGHLRLPWTHDNLTLISKKTATTFDVWMRVPAIFRFNSDYLFQLGEKFQKALVSRFVSKDFEVVEAPLETKMAKDHLGPPRWPVYSFADIANFKPLKHTYLIFESCENLKTHQVQAQLNFQNKLFENLTNMRREWLAVEARAKQKAVNREIKRME